MEAQLFDGSVAGNVRTHSASASAATPNLMSSSELFQRMRNRNWAALGNEPDHDDDDDYSPHPHSAGFVAHLDPTDLELITDIRNYVAFQSHMDGRASTQELLQEFKSQVPPQKSAQFKAMLKQICDFERLNGVGMWFLKPEFK